MIKRAKNSLPSATKGFEELSKLLMPLVLVAFVSVAAAQDISERNKWVRFGVGTRAIFTSDFLQTGPVEGVSNGVNFVYDNGYSQAIDARIRFKLRDRFSLGTGLSSMRRNYNYSISSDSLQTDGRIRSTAFQLPIRAHLMVPISKNTQAGIQLGFVQEFFPTSAASGNDSFYTVIYVRPRYKLAFDAGFQLDFKLKDNSIINVMAGYQRMLSEMATMYMDYQPRLETTTYNTPLEGHFFNLGITYYFAPASEQ